MAVTTELTAEQFLAVATGVPISVSIPVFAATDISVLYGNAGLDDAVLNTDYSIVVAVDFASFVLTPLAPLLAKIAALIVSDPTEVNRIVVRRIMAFTTVSTPGAVSGTKFTSQEFDRTAMKLMQLNERQQRAVTISDAFVDQPPPELLPGVAGDFVMFNADGDLAPGGNGLDIAGAGASATAATAAAAATAADRIAVAADRVIADADAISAAASAATALQTKGIFRGAWLTATAYAQYDQVRQGAIVYSCVTAHTSGVFATDLGAGKWTVWLQDGPSGPGSGDMLASVYDPGAKHTDAFSMGNMVETSTAKVMTGTERTKLTGIATGAQAVTAPNMYTAAIGVTATTPVAADYIPFLDVSTGLWSRALLSAFTTFFASALASTFAALSHTHSFASITSKPTTRAGYGITDAAPLSPAAGTVGSYALMTRHDNGGVSHPGNTASGANLFYSNTEGGPPNSISASGTWRCMGDTGDGGDRNDQATTLWMRIS